MNKIFYLYATDADTATDLIRKVPDPLYTLFNFVKVVIDNIYSSIKAKI